MYHKKNLDYVYLLLEDFVYQVENKNVKRSNEMYYPRFTKVIINFFMTKDPSIPIRNRVNWNFARDDPMFTTIKIVSRHEDTQLYGAILPDELTNEAIKDSESYKEYYAIASGAEPPKTKASVKKKQSGSDKTKTPPTAKGKRLKTSAKAAKPAKQKQPAKTSKLKENDRQDDEGQDDDNEQTDSDNDGDDFVHPKFSTHDQEERQDDEVMKKVMKDVNINLEERDTKMTDAQQTNVHGFISNMFNPNPDTGIDSILNLNTESTSLVDVPVSTTVEMPPSSATTIPLPPVSLIQPLQQTSVSIPTIVPSTSLQNLPIFNSVFKFKDRVKALEDDFLKFKQTNQFATVVSSIPGIVDTYLANKMNEAVKTAVQLQSDRLRDEAQAENADFINKLDDNIKKIIKEQVKAQVKEQVTKILPRIKKTINEQLEAEILTRLSNEAKTSHAVAANLSELELKKILIDKMESNKSIHRSDHQKTLYKALVDAYESDKLILDTYGGTVMIKRHRDDQDEDEEPSAGSNRGSKRRRAGKEPESTSAPKEKTSKSSGKSKEGSKYHHTSTGKSAQAEEPIHADEDLEGPAHQDNLARKEDTHDSFNELLDTPLDFSAFVMNQLKVNTLTPKLIAGPTFKLMKGLCKNLVELEYFLEEVYKATTDQLNWNNPEGQQYLHDLRKPLPLIPNS
ncbi:hypothetical protein Tco_0600975 [Tanacetum coccineum]